MEKLLKHFPVKCSIIGAVKYEIRKGFEGMKEKKRMKEDYMACFRQWLMHFRLSI